MRPIDADAFVKNIESAIENGYGVTVGDVIATIEYAPTIDAVPVVRCKDCRMTERDYLNICYTLGFIEGVVDGSNLPKEIKDAVFVAVQSIQSTIHKEFDIAERSD